MIQTPIALDSMPSIPEAPHNVKDGNQYMKENAIATAQTAATDEI